MDLQTRKISFIQDFLNLNNEKIVEKFEKLLRTEIKHNRGSFKPMTLEELNERIDRSLDDSRNGKLTNTEKIKTYK